MHIPLFSPHGFHQRQFVRLRILLLAGLFNCGTHGLEAAASPAAEAPNFRLTTTDGQTITKSSFQGKPVLLMFWAPWCQVCQEELPMIQQFYQERRPASLQILAIGFADTRTNVEQYVRDHPDIFIFPSAYDEDNVVARDYGMRATPTFVLINASGRIELVHQGGGMIFNAEFRQFLAKLRSENKEEKLEEKPSIVPENL